MKNRLTDLNNHLFAQLERLGEEDLTAEQLDIEAKRSNSMVAIADQILSTATVSLKAAKLIADHGDRFRADLPQMITGGGETASANPIEQTPSRQLTATTTAAGEG